MPFTRLGRNEEALRLKSVGEPGCPPSQLRCGTAKRLSLQALLSCLLVMETLSILFQPGGRSARLPFIPAPPVPVGVSVSSPDVTLIASEDRWMKFLLLTTFLVTFIFPSLSLGCCAPLALKASRGFKSSLFHQLCLSLATRSPRT